MWTAVRSWFKSEHPQRLGFGSLQYDVSHPSWLSFILRDTSQPQSSCLSVGIAGHQSGCEQHGCSKRRGQPSCEMSSGTWVWCHMLLNLEDLTCICFNVCANKKTNSSGHAVLCNQLYQVSSSLWIPMENTNLWCLGRKQVRTVAGRREVLGWRLL